MLSARTDTSLCVGIMGRRQRSEFLLLSRALGGTRSVAISLCVLVLSSLQALLFFPGFVSLNNFATAEHVSVDFEPLPPGTAYTVELEKAAVGQEKKATFFMIRKLLLFVAWLQGFSVR